MKLTVNYFTLWDICLTSDQNQTPPPPPPPQLRDFCPPDGGYIANELSCLFQEFRFSFPAFILTFFDRRDSNCLRLASLYVSQTP
jgi:hypothetical protein